MLSSKYAIIDGRGQIVRMGECSAESLEAQAGDYEILVVEPGEVRDDTHFWDFMQQDWREYPPCPGSWAEFDFSQREWFDPRTPADHQAALYAARKARDLSFREFLFACNEYGILSDEDMIEAANRQIPASFAEAMAGLDPKLQMQIRVTWASLTTVNRMDPLLLLVAHAKDIPPELLDALFGVVLPT
ncbi:hypothetical protein [Paracoccus sp. SY]|uniref:hypothetical protein n=1 Tax=Paracoccus sp. SY TaxID=1330255 RepID=UPI0011AFA326|nr:hypothetical protein [Paracoccus sp. SY]